MTTTVNTTITPVFTYSNTTPTINWGTTSITTLPHPTPTLHVDGNATITGSLTLGGVGLTDRLDRIEERLAILRPNEELEEKWEKLRGLRKAYMELEAEIKEKEKIWSILKR